MRPLRHLLVTILCAAGALASPASSEVVLHLYGFESESVDAVIDWGSDEANAACDRIVRGAGRTVSCPEAATSSEIRISGRVPQFGPGAASTTGNSVSRVVSWGSVGLKSLDGAFRGNSRLTSVPDRVPETIKNLRRAFQDASAFAQDLSSWGMDVKNVESMDDLFDGALAQLTDMSKWCMKNFQQEPPGLMGRSLLRAPRFRDFSSRKPRPGECGITLPDGFPAVTQTNSPFLFDLSTGVQLWSNAPAQARKDNLIFDVVSGVLPPGLELNPSTGELTGVPTVPGEYTFKIRARQL